MKVDRRVKKLDNVSVSEADFQSAIQHQRDKLKACQDRKAAILKANKFANTASLDQEIALYPMVMKKLEERRKVHSEKDIKKRLVYFWQYTQKYLDAYENDEMSCWASLTRRGTLADIRIKARNIIEAKKTSPSTKTVQLSNLLLDALNKTEHDHHSSLFGGRFEQSNLAKNIMFIFKDIGINPSYKYIKEEELLDHFWATTQKYMDKYEKEMSCFSSTVRRGTLYDIKTQGKKIISDESKDPSIRVAELSNLLLEAKNKTEADHKHGCFKGFFGESKLAKNILAIFTDIGMSPKVQDIKAIEAKIKESKQSAAEVKADHPPVAPTIHQEVVVTNRRASASI